jgi:pimeloyl-ACP methyl ester carboxylesterase
MTFLACAGATYELVGNWRDRGRFPQQGRSVQAGKVKLNLNCSGTEPPRVILDSGVGLSSIGWIKIQPELAKYARVCSYDRAGYGWSEPGPEPRTSLQIAKELKALLDAAGEPGPYVLVGPSFGGFNVRVFTGLYPADVAGVVLVDASHEDQQNRVDRIIPVAVRDQRKKDEEQEERQERLDRILTPLTVHLGVERLKAALSSDTPPPYGLPKELMNELNYLERQPKSRSAAAAEEKTMPQSAAQAHSAGTLGDRPLIILTGGKMEFTPDPLLTKEIQDQLRNLWVNVLQVEEAHLSTRGRQIILADSGHVVQFERPDAVISAVREMWSAARGTH